MKKLFTVTIETEIVVVAETREIAEQEAKKAHRDLESYQFSRHAVEMTHLPADWELDDIPFGSRKESLDRTVQGWIDAGAGEAYKAKRDRIAAAKEAKAQIEAFGRKYFG